MDKKEYIIIMRVVDALLFVLAVFFMVLDIKFISATLRALYASFFCAAAILLIITSIMDLIHMEKFVKEIKKEETLLAEKTVSEEEGKAAEIKKDEAIEAVSEDGAKDVIADVKATEEKKGE